MTEDPDQTLSALDDYVTKPGAPHPRLPTDTGTTDAGKVSDDTDKRHTPVDLVKKLREAVGGMFDTDPASGCEPIPIAELRYTEEDDGLAPANKWLGKVFLNPPFSNIPPWGKKAYLSVERGDAELVVMLVTATTLSSNWFHEYGVKAEYMCVFDDRLSFDGYENDAQFPCVMLLFAEDDSVVPDDLFRVMDDEGEIYEPADVGAPGQMDMDAFTASQTPTGPEVSAGEQSNAENTTHPLSGVGRGDLLTLKYDDTRFGVPDWLDANPTVEVTTFKEKAEEGKYEILCVQPDSMPETEQETYHMVEIDRQLSEAPTAAVQTMSSGWQQVPLESVRPVRTRPEFVKAGKRTA